MIPVTDYPALSSACGLVIFDGGVTNGLPAAEVLKRETSAGTLAWEQLPEGILLLRQRADHQLLNFLLTAPGALARWIPERNTVLELPWNDRSPELRQLGETLIERGWMLLLRRVRLTRKGALLPEIPDSVREIRAAEAPDRAAVLEILERCFSPLTGCLPTPEGLAQEQAVLLPGGTLHYRRQGNTTELRHLAVLPEARGKGLARALIAAYLEREGQRLSRVWTGADNETALHLYGSFGYVPDGWHSLVLYYLKT